MLRIHLPVKKGESGRGRCRVEGAAESFCGLVPCYLSTSSDVPEGGSPVGLPEVVRHHGEGNSRGSLDTLLLLLHIAAHQSEVEEMWLFAIYRIGI
jgi:hypothetical protein